MNVAQFDLPRYLSRLPLFHDMSAADLARVSAGCSVQLLNRGDAVFKAGEDCNAFFVVIEGQVKLYACSASGQEKIIHLIGPGESFAEAIMFGDHPYPINAQALNPTTLLTITKTAIVNEIKRDHRVALRMLAGLSRRLHGLVTDVESYTLHSGAQRVIGYLLRERPAAPSADASAPAPLRVDLPASKATIASRLSLTPEYFSKLLRELEDAQLIRIDKRSIEIIDPERLVRFQPQ